MCFGLMHCTDNLVVIFLLFVWVEYTNAVYNCQFAKGENWNSQEIWLDQDGHFKCRDKFTRGIKYIFKQIVTESENDSIKCHISYTYFVFSFSLRECLRCQVHQAAHNWASLCRQYKYWINPSTNRSPTVCVEMLEVEGVLLHQL